MGRKVKGKKGILKRTEALCSYSLKQRKGEGKGEEGKGGGQGRRREGKGHISSKRDEHTKAPHVPPDWGIVLVMQRYCYPRGSCTCHLTGFQHSSAYSSTRT